MKEKTTKSGTKSIVMGNNNCSFDLNRSVANSIITSSYIILKDGTKKRKRHPNSYIEEFLEKRRMAAEFAQTKRSTSSKNPRVRIDKNLKDTIDENYSLNIKKIEQVISIQNLKNNLPGKTTAIIDNTNIENEEIILDKNIDNNKFNMIYPDNINKYNKYINIPNKEDSIDNTKNLIINNQNINNNYYINKQNNFNYNMPNITKEIVENNNKYNNIKRHNIVYTKKKGQNLNNNKNISNHSFTENRYSSINQDNEDQCNIINTNTNELNNSNNKELELLGPQLPEDAFLQNNINNKNIVTSIQNDYITLENNCENTEKKSLSKDIQNAKNFKDISPIKYNNTQTESIIQKLNNDEENGENENINIYNENINNKQINKSEHFLSLIQKMINNKVNDKDVSNNLQSNQIINKSTNIPNSNIINNIINEQSTEDKDNSNTNLYEKENKNSINNNEKDNDHIKNIEKNSNEINELINFNKNVSNNNGNKNIKNVLYEKYLNKNENIKIENINNINNENKEVYSIQDNNYEIKEINSCSTEVKKNIEIHNNIQEKNNISQNNKYNNIIDINKNNDINNNNNPHTNNTNNNQMDN